MGIDGRCFERPWFLIEVLNIGAIGPRLPFAPRADAQDKVLDILLVGEADRDAMVQWAEHFSGPSPACIETGCVATLQAKELWSRIDDSPVDVPEEEWTVEVRLDDEPVTIWVPVSITGDENGSW